MTINTNITYQGQTFQILQLEKCKHAYKYSLSKTRNELYNSRPSDNVLVWRIMGCEDYTYSYKLFNTEKEAETHAKATAEKWTRENNKRKKETAEYRKLLEKTFYSYEDAAKAGCKHPVKYNCRECGNVFCAEWRSKYSPNPTCPCCHCNDMTV